MARSENVRVNARLNARLSDDLRDAPRRRIPHAARGCRSRVPLVWLPVLLASLGASPLVSPNARAAEPSDATSSSPLHELPPAEETRTADPNLASPYRIRWGYDAGLVALGGALAMTAFIGHPKPPCYPGCTPPTNMLGIDDASVGNYSRPALTLASVGVFALVAAPLVIHAADTRFRGWFEDTAVILESILLTQGITQVMKSAVGRPAPFVYNPNVAQSDLDSPDAFRSFISGHTSTSFAAATAYSVTFWKRHPTSAWRFVVLGATHALAATVGLLKVHAGYHYATDIAAGALVGSAMGLLVPVLHSEW